MTSYTRFASSESKPLGSIGPKWLVLMAKISCVRDRQGSTPPSKNLFFAMDETLMDYTSTWCYACNMQATSHQLIKNLLYGPGMHVSQRDSVRPFANIPLSTSLPMGMRVMHDVYAFMYIMCSCIAALNKALYTDSSAELSQAKVCTGNGCHARVFCSNPTMFVCSGMENPRAHSSVHWFHALHSQQQNEPSKKAAFLRTLVHVLLP